MNNIQIKEISVSPMKPNIILILVDSLRADKLFGKNSAKTPQIDSLMKKGVYFENCFSSSDYTITGYGAIFTGRYPINAGRRGMNYYKVFSKTPDIVSALKKNDYHVFSTMDSTFFDLEKGLGFTEFENNDQGYDRAKTNLFEDLGDRVLKTLDIIKKSEPWFYFIHLNDLHIPVRVPKKFEGLKYSERYDVVVSEIDRWIGKIVESVDLQNTVVIVTADHGDYILSYDDSKKESSVTTVKSKLRKSTPSKLYDFFAVTKRKTQHEIRKAKTRNEFDRRYLHTRTAPERFLYDDVIHVPLLFVGKNIPPKNPIQNLVRSIDISPTLAELVDVEIDKNIDGRSLVALFNNEKMEEEPVYLENTIFNTGIKTTKAHMGIRDSKYKYFRLLDSTNDVHLYDIENDPLEITNIASENPEVVNKLESQMMKIRNRLLDKHEEVSLTTDETKKIEEELKKLGYI